MANVWQLGERAGKMGFALFDGGGGGGSQQHLNSLRIGEGEGVPSDYYHMQVYSEVSPPVYNGAYSQERCHRTTAQATPALLCKLIFRARLPEEQGKKMLKIQKNCLN